MGITLETNPEPLVELLYNPYQWMFLEARRQRACPTFCTDATGAVLTWSVLERPDCPSCGLKGIRTYRQFFLRAGRRGGKTRIGALSAIEEALTNAGSIGWCCAPSYPELHDYVMPAFFSQLPTTFFNHPLSEWSKDRLSLKLPNRSQVHFRSLDDPNRGAGPGLHWAWIDEGRKIQELAWQLLRPSLTEFKGIAWVTSTPDWGEDWCHRHFWVPAAEGRPGTWATSYHTKDNPIIDPAEVERARATMPPELFRREYEASIEFPSGTIYGDVLEPCLASDDEIRGWMPEWPRIDPSRPCIVGLDPGTDHPFAGSLIIVTPRGLVLAGEYCERNKPFYQHAMGLKALLHGVGGLTPRWGIDKSQAQAAIELSQHGIYAQGAPNAVDAGIQRVYAWMGTRKLLISRTRCPKTIKELRAYRWAPLEETKKGLQADGQPFKKDDDLCDAVRYGVMLWPELPTAADLDHADPSKRNLALLSDDVRRQIERNLTAEPEESGLVRVTDDFWTHREPEPTQGASLSDFYA
jgi:hypothetical protein